MTNTKFNANWDVDKYKNDYESEEHWSLRRQFMLAHKNRYPEQRLVCLTQVFFNMEFLGCKYPEKTMELVNRLALEVAKDFRDSRKDKLKRTFVGAQDAAGAKAKGAKPPQGSVEGSQNKQSDDTDSGSFAKRPHMEEGPPARQDDRRPEHISRQEQVSQVGRKPPPDCKDMPPDLIASLKQIAKDCILTIPIRFNSKTEEDAYNIVKYNFRNKKMSHYFYGSKKDGWTCEIKVNPVAETPKYSVGSAYALLQKEAKYLAATNVIENLRKFCAIVEPNPAWFLDGGTPDFIKNRIPCNKNPRTYLIMTKKDTGVITSDVAIMLMENFLRSSNEDMFFIDVEYSEKEKKELMRYCEKQLSLGFRHFGTNLELKDHHCCVYKRKTAEEIMEEARKADWKHPKYIVTV